MALTHKVALNLVPLVSDVTGPTDKVDVELHLPLLQQFMEAFPMKAPNESDLIAGVSFEIEVRVKLGPQL